MGEREDDARASREDSPSSSPSSSGRRARTPPRCARARRARGVAFAAGEGPPPSPSTRAADAFRAARMGRADALEAMIRAGEIHQDATDASSEHAFSLLMAAAMNGAGRVGEARAGAGLLSLGANARLGEGRAVDAPRWTGAGVRAATPSRTYSHRSERPSATGANARTSGRRVSARRDAVRGARASGPRRPRRRPSLGRAHTPAAPLDGKGGGPARHRRERVTARSGVGNTRRPSRNGRKRRR